jgi:hypothetical protein
MKTIVADVYGQGTLIDKDGTPHELSASEWREADLRDQVVTGPDQTAVVRYRQDGLELEIGPNRTYGIEGDENPDVIDVRGHWENLARRILEALNNEQEQQVVELLDEAAGDDGKVPDVLEDEFRRVAGKALRDALKDGLPWMWEALALRFVD